MSEVFIPPTLKEDCVRSSEIYLKYLEENKEAGKGMLRARVWGIQGTMLDSNLVLMVDKEIRYPEEMTIRVGGTVYENTDENKQFVIQSADKRKITITPTPQLAEHIVQAMQAKEEVFAEIDLTFLVRRVKEWYEKHGDKVALPTMRPECSLVTDNPIALSDSQCDCAEKAIGSPLAYIWGAPGTGKTKHVLASCVCSYIRAGKKVVLVAPTNNALEQSLSGLLWALTDAGIIPDGKVLRLGLPGERFKLMWPNVCEAGAFAFLKAEIEEEISRLKYENKLIEISLEVRAGKSKEGAEDRYPGTSDQELNGRKRKNIRRINELMGQSHQMTEKKSAMPLISWFNVVAATVDSCIHRLCPGDSPYKADHVFLDEAGYCNIIKGMALTGFGCPLTMLGDHKQLPPVFDCEDPQLQKNPKTRIVRLWEVSTLYMEDAMDDRKRQGLCQKEPNKPTFEHTETGALKETHRFGPELAKVLAGKVYGPDFCSRSVNETRILYINAPKKAEDKGKDEKGEHKRTSSRERRLIRDLIEHNLAYIDCTVGIITPYNKQRNPMALSMNRLMKKYERMEDMEDDVLNVHRSQGREWDVVIYSIVDSFDERFFSDSTRPDSLKLINTAVSRAKKVLILVGDADDWRDRDGQLISDLFRVAEEVDTDILFRDYIEETDEDEKEECKP